MKINVVLGRQTNNDTLSNILISPPYMLGKRIK